MLIPCSEGDGHKVFCQCQSGPTLNHLRNLPPRFVAYYTLMKRLQLCLGCNTFESSSVADYEPFALIRADFSGLISAGWLALVWWPWSVPRWLDVRSSPRPGLRCVWVLSSHERNSVGMYSWWVVVSFRSHWHVRLGKKSVLG